MPGRRDPAWTNIPLATEAVKRTTTPKERAEREKRKKKEEEKMKERRKQEAQMAKILAQRWAEEDAKKQAGEVPAASSSVPKSSKRRRSPSREDGGARARERRRDRDADVPSTRRQRTDSEDSGRHHARERRPQEPEEPEEENSQEAGGWHSKETNSSILSGRTEPLSIGGLQQGRKEAQKPTPSVGKKHSVKVAGFFGADDSDDDRETAKRELEAARAAKESRVRAATPLPFDKFAASSGSQLAGKDERLASSSDIQMRLAQFKMQCKGKWVDMPEDLRRDVDRLMGNSR